MNKARLRIGAIAEHDQEFEVLKEELRRYYADGHPGFGEFLKLFEMNVPEGGECLARLVEEIPELRPLAFRWVDFTFTHLLLSIMNDDGRLCEADGRPIPTLREREN